MHQTLQSGDRGRHLNLLLDLGECWEAPAQLSCKFQKCVKINVTKYVFENHP